MIQPAEQIVWNWMHIVKFTGLVSICFYPFVFFLRQRPAPPGQLVLMAGIRMRRRVGHDDYGQTGVPQGETFSSLAPFIQLNLLRDPISGAGYIFGHDLLLFEASDDAD